MSYVSETDRLKESIVLHDASAPAGFGFHLTVGQGDQVASDGAGGLLVKSAVGKVVFEVLAPSMTDAAGVSGPVTLKAGPSGSGWDVQVVADSGWLGSASRAWPVTIDPTVVYNASNPAGDRSGPPDCTIVQAGGSNCGSSALSTGVAGTNQASRALIGFPVSINIPTTAKVLDAGLDLSVTASTPAATSVTVSAYPLAKPFNYGASWTSTGGGQPAWSTPGGDTLAACGDTGQAAADSQTGTFPAGSPVELYVRCAVQGWVSNPASNDGLLLRTAEQATKTVSFASAEASINQPSLWVLYSNPLGSPKSQTLSSQALDKSETLGVDVADGNANVATKDYAVSADGLGLTMTRSYNSQATTAGSSFGTGWNFDLGPDVHVAWETNAIENRGLVYYDAAGTAWLFEYLGGKYVTPAGLNADATFSNGLITIVDHASQTKLSFVQDRTIPNSNNYVLSSIVDRHANTIVDTYSPNNGAWTAITSYRSGDTQTQGRSWTVTHNGAGRVTAIAESNFTGGTDPVTGAAIRRAINFGYDTTNTYLTSYTDANGVASGGSAPVTAYHYSPVGLLDTVTTPTGAVTAVGYSGQNAAASVTTNPDPSHGIAATTTYSYTQNLLDIAQQDLPGGTTAGWNAGTAQSIAGIPDPHQPGLDDLKVIGGTGPTTMVSTTPGTGAVPAAAGQGYFARFVATSPYQGTINVTPQLVFYNSSGTAIATTSGTAQQVGYSDYALAYLQTAAPAGTSYVAVGASMALFAGGPISGLEVDMYNADLTLNNVGSGPGLPYTPQGACAGTTPTGGSFDPAVGSSSATDANGHVTLYCYDAGGQVTATVDGAGRSRSTSYTPNGDVSTLADAMATPGIATSSYDGLNNLTGIQAPSENNGTVPGRQTSMGYPTPSQPPTATNYQPSSSKDTQGHPTGYNYDTYGNLHQVADANGNMSTINHNSDGTVSSTAAPGGSCTGTVNHCTTNSYTYSTGNPDLLTTSVTQPPSPLGATTASFDADGRATSHTDGKGQTSTVCYDNNDRPTAEFTNGATPNCQTRAGAAVTYTYDTDGNLISQSTPSTTTSYSYDGANRLIGKTQGATTCNVTAKGGATIAATSCLALDKVGNVTTYTDAGGTVVYNYDPANQNIAVGEPGATTNNQGQLACSVTNGNPPIQVTSGHCTAFAYNNNGFRTNTLYPSGELITASADNSGRTTQVSGNQANRTNITDISYSYTTSTNADAGLIQNITRYYPVNQSQSRGDVYTYGPLNQLTADQVSLSDPQGRGFTNHYQYDPQGDRTENDHNGTPTYYAYNDAQQLCAISTSPTSTCNGTGNTYDANGNETAAADAPGTLTYNPLNQTTTGQASETYT